MIRFQCQCGRLLDVADEYAGKQVRCPSCQQVAVAPAAPAPPAIPAAVPAPGAFVGTGLPPLTQRDLGHERHIRAISFWDRLAGILMLIGGLCGIAGTGFLASKGGGAATAMAGGFTVVYLFLGAAFYAVGHYLWHYHNWARWTQIFLCALQVLNSLQSLRQPGGVIAVIISLAWTGAMLWALLSANAVAICSPSYRDLVQRTPHERVTWWTSPFFYLPFVAVGALCLGGLLIGGVVGMGR